MCAAMLLLATAVYAAPTEVIETRLDGVSAASREIVVNGETWPLSSTVAIQLPGKPRATLQDVTAGMNVRLSFESTDAEFPLVRSITVLPD
jgi:hypothetical protein